MGKHKDIPCKYCYKIMRSDNLKKHYIKCKKKEQQVSNTLYNNYTLIEISLDA